MLKVQNLSVNIDNKNVLNDISFDLEKGEIIAILGPNGHGKSTIFKSIFNHYKINKTSGEISSPSDNPAFSSLIH